MPRQDTTLESEGAEFLVLGQLLIEGIPAYKAYANFPGYDLIATSPDATRAARIQVKTRWATGAPFFLIKNFDCDFVVLVRLNRGYRSSKAAKQPSQPQEPEYYVLTAKEAEDRLSDRKTGWEKIHWKAEAFATHRRNWSAVRDFLKTAES